MSRPREFRNITCEIAAGVATVTVNRPTKLNALNAATIADLDACFASLGSDVAIRAVVLTGAGEKAFVAGADIGELVDLTREAAEQLAQRGQQLMQRIDRLGKPVIAAVNGFALGGGCELALACSFRYAADTARLGLPETGLGLIPGYGGTQRLARLIGRGRAAEMVLRGHMVGAAEALSIGLVDRVVPAADLAAEVAGVAAELAVRSPLALRLALQAVGMGLDVGLDDGCRLEATLFGAAASSRDAGEGCRAFLEKRRPVFGGD